MRLVWKDPDGKPVVAGEVHKRMWAFLDRAYEKRIPALVLAPRGCGKTECGAGLVTRLLAGNPRLRVSVVSDNEEHGVDRLTTIRHYIEKDPDFRRLFPEIQVDRSGRGRRTLSKFRLSAARYAKDPSCLGTGVLSGGTGSRADVQFYDDLCTEANSILAPQNRERIKKAFFGTWRFCLAPGGWWFYIGTLYHEDDLTHALRSSPGTARLVIGLDPDTMDHYNVEEWWPGDAEPKTYTLPLWEPMWTKARYEAVRGEAMALGDASKFYAGFCNILIDPAVATFRHEHFKRAFVVKPLSKYQIRVLYADPASASNREACFYAGIVLGWDAEEEKAVVLHAWRVKEALTQRVERYLRAVTEWQPHVCSVEGQHELAFAERIEERAAEEGMAFRLRKITHGTTDKIARLGSLAPLMAHGRILIDIESWPFFWHEARVFPAGKVDALDALEGAWSQLRLWLRQRMWVPRKFPVLEQYQQRGSVPVHKYEFGPRVRGVSPAVRQNADLFFA